MAYTKLKIAAAASVSDAVVMGARQRNSSARAILCVTRKAGLLLRFLLLVGFNFRITEFPSFFMG